ncbi:MAG TPA: XRE family transcriptional regulator [Actinophytocola sp.]|jgi:Zn-dependent peptidase ImmA (M78 family)/DNA-binding XRE family transcriptional regulator|uniref:helix-turn-helix domain-containing protein n=1 Tax=Actinophytocola sp. TaxID=1872138 RepID=UPI002E006FA5|nr:XRE family transcriptional regulator [Actinophytocola sp.]
MFNPQRLVLARKRRGLTATELARRVALTGQSISNYERGRSTPSARTLDRIAAELGFPLPFFSGPDIPDLPEPALAFRARTKLAASQRDAARGAACLAIEFNSWLERHFRLPEPDVPTLDKPDPETAAEMVRSRWALGTTPIPNTVHLLEAHGVRVFSLATDCTEVDAFSFWHNGRPFVILNMLKSAERGRFDAAHELGHLVLHSGSAPHDEFEANAFAAAVLMPRTSIQEQLPPSPLLTHILRAKHAWKVSALALTYRLHDLGLLTDWQYRHTCVELAKRGYRRAEPDGLPRENSQLLTKVWQHLRHTGTTPTDAAAALNITPEDLHSLTFGLTLGPTPGSGGFPGTGTPLVRPKLALVRDPDGRRPPAEQAGN